MSIPAEQIPLWFWIIAIIGLFGAVVALFKLVLDNKKEDWTEIKSAVKETIQNINELVMIQTLHTHQIKENSDDIKDLQAKVSGSPIVKYEKA